MRKDKGKEIIKNIVKSGTPERQVSKKHEHKKKKIV